MLVVSLLSDLSYNHRVFLQTFLPVIRKVIRNRLFLYRSKASTHELWSKGLGFCDQNGRRLESRIGGHIRRRRLTAFALLFASLDLMRIDVAQ